MSQIPRETVEQVLAATDIVDLISSYMPVKRAGSRFQTLCPFHNEKSPSFSIDPIRQFYHCFGCKKSGDAISFVREYENLTFSDAVKKLATRAGVTIVEQALDPKEEADRRKRGRLLDLHREISAYYHHLLLTSPDAAPARDYLKARGFGKEMAERWEIGWAPPPNLFVAWAKGKGLRGRDLVDSGVALQKEQGGLYFRFRDRLMFPIRNDYGDVIAFSGRQLREDPRSGKYINSPETALFKKSNVLFALDKARKGILDEKAVLLCEGQIDAIACHERGIPHAIAPLGTAFTPQHAKTLKRYAKEALLCFDADSAGYTAAERAFRELAGVGIAVRVVNMPAGEDPDSFMQQHGTDAFRALLDQAVNFFDFRIQRAVADGQLKGPQEKAAFTRECADLLAVVGDPVTRDAMIQHVATRLRLGSPELMAAVGEARRKPAPRRFDRADDSEARPVVIEPSPLDRRIGTLCTLALHSSEARDWLGEQFESLHELATHLDGLPILQAILAERPDPQSPASINSFMAGLPESDRLALHQEPSFSEPLPDDPRGAAELTLADASALALEKRDAEIKAALNAPDLKIEEQLQLLKEAKQIAELLSGLNSRAINTDRFAPSNRPRKQKKPWERDDYRDKRSS
jgi:DNA primase